MIVSTVRSFVEKEICPYEAEVDGGFAVMNEWLYARRITGAGRTYLGWHRRDTAPYHQPGLASAFGDQRQVMAKRAFMPPAGSGMRRPLDRLLRPKSVVVIGDVSWCASVVGQRRRMRFAKNIWPVHPKRDEVGGAAALARL
jgi:hypothetical protein